MIIYKITNRVNGKIYIGQTTKPLIVRWRLHCSPGSGCNAMKNAIQKYGKENFTVEQIDVACDQEELDKKEQYWISHYDCIAPKGYNLTIGGEHPKLTDETRKRISKAVKGRIGSMLGKRHSNETKEKISKSRYGKYRGSANGRSVKVFCIELTETFDCAKEAGRQLAIDPSSIIACCRGRRKSAGGFTWEYDNHE